MDEEGMDQPVVRTVKIGDQEMSMVDAEARVRGSASWFYWIAGLSALNWLAMAMNLSYSMIVGLGVTQVASALTTAPAQSEKAAQVTLSIASFLVTASVSGMFVFLGYQARRVLIWPFVVGLVLYGLDALIFVVARDWIAFGFHAFVMVMLWSGVVTTRAIVQTRSAAVTIGSLTRSDRLDT